VVEDDRTLRQAITYNLAREGYEVRSAVDGEQALAAVRSQPADLVLLDVMLPGMSGLEVLRTMRAEGIDTPVLILSAKGEEIDRVVGLKVGADDYVTKPFSRPELFARVEAVLRRVRRAVPPVDSGPETIRAGGLVIDRGARRAEFAGTPLSLTPREFDLLAHLAANPDRVFTREQLLSRLWGHDYDGDARTLDVHVSWLRTKLRALDGQNHLRTVRGVGYAFVTEPGAA